MQIPDDAWSCSTKSRGSPKPLCTATHSVQAMDITGRIFTSRTKSSELLNSAAFSV